MNCAYVDPSISLNHIQNLDHCTCDFQFFCLKLCSTRCFCWCCSSYGGDFSPLFPFLHTHTHTHTHTHYKALLHSEHNVELWVVGDINVHNTNWLPYSFYTDLADLAAERFYITNSLSQFVHSPTRTPVHAQILNLLLTTHSYLYTVSYTSPLGSSELHTRFHIILCFHIPYCKFRYSSAGWKIMHQFFNTYPWECCHSNDHSDLIVIQQFITGGYSSQLRESLLIEKASQLTWEIADDLVRLKGDAHKQTELFSPGIAVVSNEDSRPHSTNKLMCFRCGPKVHKQVICNVVLRVHSVTNVDEWVISPKFVVRRQTVLFSRSPVQTMTLFYFTCRNTNHRCCPHRGKRS